MNHPAKYSDAILPVLEKMLPADKYPILLDPFAGTGKLHQVRPDAVLVEIEPEWAAEGRAIVGNALSLPFKSEAFDAICTSPCYGNRMADHHNAKDSSRRNTYTHTLGRTLHPDNSGTLQWGEKYIDFHLRAWKECIRVLKMGGLFVLNCKDHYRHGELQLVTVWHVTALIKLGALIKNHELIQVTGNRFGQNYEKRVSVEYVIEFIKGKK